MFRRIVEDYEAQLTPTVDAGNAFAQARGKSEHERFADGEIEFDVRLRDIELPDGASLGIRVNGLGIASIPTQGGRATVRMNNTAAHALPPVVDGSRIEIMYDDRVVLTGTYVPD